MDASCSASRDAPPNYDSSFPPKEDISSVEAGGPPASVSGFSGSVQAPPVVGPEAAASGLMPGQTVTVLIAHPPAKKSLFEAYLLWFPLGFLGLHHFYLKRYGFGVLYLFTAGLVGIGWLVDMVRMPFLVKEANRKIMQQHPEEIETVSIVDAYLTWFPLGIIGLHQYYLRRVGWGVAYTFSAGFFGIGWLVDLFRIPSLVRSTNKRLEQERLHTERREANLCDAYALGITPAGIFGGHHFYLKRYAFGVFYALTLGICGIGWIVDWFRMKWLVHRANHPEEHPLGTRHKFLDDAYVMAFPFGILGLHHFYLERKGWGVLYIFTAGLFVVGWLTDLFRMPCLVSETNKRLEDEMKVVAEIERQFGVQTCSVIHGNIVYPSPAPGTTVMPVNQYATETPILEPPSYDATMAASLAAGTSSGGHDASQALPGKGVEAKGAAGTTSTASYAEKNEAFEDDRF